MRDLDEVQTETPEDYEREGIPEDKFKDATQHHEHPTEKEICCPKRKQVSSATIIRTILDEQTHVPAAPPPPAPLQPIKAHDSGVKQSRKPITELRIVSTSVQQRL